MFYLIWVPYCHSIEFYLSNYCEFSRTNSLCKQLKQLHGHQHSQPHICITELNIHDVQTARTEKLKTNSWVHLLEYLWTRLLPLNFASYQKICSFTEVNVNYVKWYLTQLLEHKPDLLFNFVKSVVSKDVG